VFSGNTFLFGFFNRNVGNDPIEVISITNSGAAIQAQIAIGRFAGPDPSLMKYVAFRSNFVVNQFATNSGTIFGHANAVGAEAVGAADYRDTPAFGQSPPLLEPFSSAGTTPILFDLAGNPINDPRADKPEIVAPDGADTTFFGVDVDGTGFPNFFGTSAAAPHAAAVAGLLLELNPTLTPVQIYGSLESTAINMRTPGFDNDSGFGLIKADDALASVPSPLDTTAPGPITNIKRIGATQTTIDFTFTAPGDDDKVGMATSYDFRVSSQPIDDSNFGLATPIGGAPAPTAAGTTQSATVKNLLCNRFYYVAGKAMDDAKNLSPVSIDAKAKTTACNKLIPSPKTLPVGEAGVPYMKTVDLVNGASPYDVQFDPTTVPPWLATNALVASSKLVAPNFLANSSFTLTGTPPLTEAGKTFNIAAVITDAVGSVRKAKFKLKVAKPVEITTTALKPGKVNKAYNATPRAKNGVKAYSWTAKSNSALPSGSTFAFDPVKGKISVLATAVGSVDVTFQVTDAAGGTDTQILTLTFNL
jgi:hypothetical protein